MRYQAMGAVYSPAYPADDARSWRNECVQPGQARRLGDVLNEWKAQYTELHWIGFPRCGWPHIWTEEDPGFKVSCVLFLAHS